VTGAGARAGGSAAVQRTESDTSEPEPDVGPHPDLRLLPVAVATWTATWVGTGGPAGGGTAGLAGGLAGAVVATGLAMRRGSLVAAAVALALLAGLTVGWSAQYRLAAGPVADLAARRAVVEAAVVIRRDPTVHVAAGVRPDYLTVRAELVAVAGRGESWRLSVPVLVTVSGPAVADWRAAPVGTTLAASARLEPRTAGSDVAAVLRVRGGASVTAPPAAGLRVTERVRAGLRTAVERRRPEPRALVPALVLGDTSALTATLTEDFETTGLTHLTAVSGANLTLLLAFLLLASRWLGVRGWWLRLVGLLGVAIFVALCRTEPSVLRAAAMGLVALAALGTGSVRAGVRNLCVAATVLLLVDPLLSRSVGFALSVLASGGIIWWARSWAVAMSAWAPRLVAEAVAVPLAAQLATLPVVAALSGAVSVVGLVTNALAGPFVGPATVFGFLAAGTSLLSARLAAAAGFLAAWSAQPIIWVAHAGAAVPGAALPWPTEPLALVLLGVVALTAALGLRLLLVRRWICLLAALGLVAGLVWVPAQPGWPPRGWMLVACDVGQGDGLAIRVGQRQAVVVDTGPDPPAIRRCLDQLGVTEVPLLVLTHFHADHVAGLEGVLAGRRVGQIWTSPYASPPGEAHRTRAVAADHAIPVRVPSPGERGLVGQASWEVLGPVAAGPAAAAGGEEGESGVENDASLVLRLTVAGVRVLLTGDVEPAGQEALLAAGLDLGADVLKVPHHGSSRQEVAFLAATGARVAVASAGRDNDYGHPAPRTVARLESLGMTLLRTDSQGAVAVVVRDGNLGAVTQR